MSWGWALYLSVSNLNLMRPTLIHITLRSSLRIDPLSPSDLAKSLKISDHVWGEFAWSYSFHNPQLSSKHPNSSGYFSELGDFENFMGGLWLNELVKFSFTFHHFCLGSNVSSYWSKNSEFCKDSILENKVKFSSALFYFDGGI